QRPATERQRSRQTRGATEPAGAEKEAAGPAGAVDVLLAGQPGISVVARHLSAWRKWVVAVRALFERRSDECRACHHWFQHRMRRAPEPQGSRRDRRKSDWLADEPAPRPFKHQRELSEAPAAGPPREREEGGRAAR